MSATDDEPWLEDRVVEFLEQFPTPTAADVHDFVGRLAGEVAPAVIAELPTPTR